MKPKVLNTYFYRIKPGVSKVQGLDDSMLAQVIHDYVPTAAEAEVIDYFKAKRIREKKHK